MTIQLSATEARKRLFSMIDEANDDCEVFEIVGKRGSVFVVPASEYRGWAETQHVFGQPGNARRLAASLANIEAGNYVEMTWDELEALLDAREAKRQTSAA